MRKMYLFLTILFISGFSFGQQKSESVIEEAVIEDVSINTLNENSNKSVRSSPQYYNYNTPDGWDGNPGAAVYGMTTQLLFLAGEFNKPISAPAGDITSISIGIYGACNSTYTDFTIKLGQSDITSMTYGGLYGPLTTVYYRPSVTLTVVSGDWLTITLDSPFAYDPNQSLIVEIGQCGRSGTQSFQSGFKIGSGKRRVLSDYGCPATYRYADFLLYQLGIDIDAVSPPTVPISNWPIYLGILVIGAFIVIRFRIKLV